MLCRSYVFPLACVAALAGLAGCAPDTLPPTQGSAASASPTTGGPLDGTPEPDSELAADDQPATGGATIYACNDGHSVRARYTGADKAVVVYRQQTRHMHIAISADGARYVGNGYEWWTRGSGRGAQATLFKHAADGSTGDVVTSCHQQ